MSNILFICPNPIWGGAATANLTIANLLQECGHNVIFNDEYSQMDEYDLVKIDHTPLHQRRFSDRTLLKKLINQHQIEFIIWSPLAAIYFYWDIINLKSDGIPQIAIVHSLSLKNNAKGKLMDFLVSLTLSKMSSIVYVSQYTKNSWKKYRAIRRSNANQIVIHNFVSFSQLNSPKVNNLKNNTPKIGFVGRLSPEKQPHLFCELSLQLPYTFNLYGDGPLISELKKKYSNVNFKGLCKDVNKIYSNIDILVMTSKFENCPMVILEAQAFGIPCVAPNVGGIPELVKNKINGVLYNEFNVELIIDAIKEILNNYEYYSYNSYKSYTEHKPYSVIPIWEQALGLNPKNNHR